MERSRVARERERNQFIVKCRDDTIEWCKLDAVAHFQTLYTLLLFCSVVKGPQSFLCWPLLTTYEKDTRSTQTIWVIRVAPFQSTNLFHGFDRNNAWRERESRTKAAHESSSRACNLSKTLVIEGVSSIKWISKIISRMRCVFYPFSNSID